MWGGSFSVGEDPESGSCGRTQSHASPHASIVPAGRRGRADASHAARVGHIPLPEAVTARTSQFFACQASSPLSGERSLRMPSSDARSNALGHRLSACSGQTLRTQQLNKPGTDTYGIRRRETEEQERKHLTSGRTTVELGISGKGWLLEGLLGDRH